MSQEGGGDRWARAGNAVWMSYASLTATMVFYSISNVLSRVMRDDIPPAAFSFWRYLAAAVILAPFVARSLVVHRAIVARHWRALFAAATLQTTIGQTLFFLGLHTTTATNGALITAAQPAFVVLFARLLLRERISTLQSVGLIAAASGAIVIVARGSPAALLGLDIVIGDLFIVLAIAGWGLYAILIRNMAGALPPFVMFEVLAVFAVLGTLPLYLAEAAWGGQRLTVSGAAVGTLLYMAVFGSILALSFMISGINRIGAPRAAMFNYLQPPFTAIAAWLTIGETLAVYHGVGLGLILIGVFLANRVRSRESPTMPSPPAALSLTEKVSHGPS
ncbi:MAG: DMT family transporter [Alphaproteobacteria bacterium]|nr:DMT family transporter [Alphaproteobacteria bacterium]